MPLIENVLIPLAKSVLILLGLTTVASPTDAAIHKKMFGSGAHPSYLAKRTTLVISKEEMNNAMKVIKSFKESVLLIKGISETIKNEARKQKG